MIGFLINVQVQGQDPHQWAPFQIAGLLHAWQISHQISRYVYHRSCSLTLQICLIIALSFRCRRWRFGFVNGQVWLAWSIALFPRVGLFHVFIPPRCQRYDRVVPHTSSVVLTSPVLMLFQISSVAPSATPADVLTCKLTRNS